MGGFIKDYRKEVESDVWLMPPLYHRVWQWLKYDVNHAEGRIPNKDGSVTVLKPGQTATSYREIAKGVGYYEQRRWKEPNPKTVKSILDWLVKQNMIVVYGNTNGTIVTIENWTLYQSKNLEGNTKRTTGETLVKHCLDTNKKNKEELKKNKEKTFSSDSEEYRLSHLLYSFILKRNENQKEPNFQTWAKQIDLMIRKDKREPSEIQRIITWCQCDSFWKNNILSTKKLRDKYDQLNLKSKEGGNWSQQPDSNEADDGYDLSHFYVDIGGE